MRKVLISALILIATNVHAWSLFGSYDDCVLENIKNAQTPPAVAAIHRACRSKYPEEPKKPVDYPALDNVKLTPNRTEHQQRPETATIDSYSPPPKQYDSSAYTAPLMENVPISKSEQTRLANKKAYIDSHPECQQANPDYRTFLLCNDASIDKSRISR